MKAANHFFRLILPSLSFQEELTHLRLQSSSDAISVDSSSSSTSLSAQAQAFSAAQSAQAVSEQRVQELEPELKHLQETLSHCSHLQTVLSEEKQNLIKENLTLKATLQQQQQQQASFFSVLSFSSLDLHSGLFVQPASRVGELMTDLRVKQVK